MDVQTGEKAGFAGLHSQSGKSNVFCARVPSGIGRELAASGNRQHWRINVSSGSADSLQFLRGVKKIKGFDGVFIAVGNEEPVSAIPDGDARVLGLSFTTRDVEKVSQDLIPIKYTAVRISCGANQAAFNVAVGDFNSLRKQQRCLYQ